jgi:hypothetical protein
VHRPIAPPRWFPDVAALILVAALGLSACGEDRANQLDLLFVIDTSGSNREEQAALAAAMPALLTHLEQRPGGLPSTHIGVVSADMGAGPTPIGSSCRPAGDRGALQVRAGCGLDPAQARFLSAGAGREPNFTGTLAETAGCLVQLGIDGCGYEQHLVSMEAAVSPRPGNSENWNFQRASALLAVVILADEDDCSGEPTSTFYQSVRPGEGMSLRCATLGHVCNGQPVPAQAGFTAPLSTCEPYRRTAQELQTRLVGLQAFVEGLKRLKRYQDNLLFVGAIAGWDDAPTAEYRIVDVSPGELQLGSICASPALGAAAPAIRLRTFTRSFANHAFHSICANDLTAAMDDIGRKLSAALR